MGRQAYIAVYRIPARALQHQHGIMGVSRVTRKNI